MLLAAVGRGHMHSRYAESTSRLCAAMWRVEARAHTRHIRAASMPFRRDPSAPRLQMHTHTHAHQQTRNTQHATRTRTRTHACMYVIQACATCVSGYAPPMQVNIHSNDAKAVSPFRPRRGSQCSVREQGDIFTRPPPILSHTHVQYTLIKN